MEQRITKPLLSTGFEAFTHWHENYNWFEGICKEAKTEQRRLLDDERARFDAHVTNRLCSTVLKIDGLVHQDSCPPSRVDVYLAVGPTLDFLKIVLPHLDLVLQH